MSLEKINVGGVHVSAADVNGLLDELAGWRTQQQSAVILCLNAHISNRAAEDRRLTAALNAATFVGADGMSIVWAARWLGHTFPGRCNMTDAFRAYLQRTDARPSNAILVGGTDEIARLAVEQINTASHHCRVGSWLNGYAADADYASFFSAHADVDLVLIGMGTPRSEYLVCLAQKHCPHAVVWHIGGGTILFYAGTTVEAPAWMGRAGLQWVHRLLVEPRRLWKRYVWGNPRFCLRVLKQVARLGPRGP